MISLPALEEPFAQQYPPTQDGPRVAVEGVEKDGGRRIVLFTTEALNLQEANAKLMGRRRARRDAARRGAEGRQDPGAGHGEDGLQGVAGAD